MCCCDSFVCVYKLRMLWKRKCWHVLQYLPKCVYHVCGIPRWPYGIWGDIEIQKLTCDVCNWLGGWEGGYIYHLTLQEREVGFVSHVCNEEGAYNYIMKFLNFLDSKSLTSRWRPHGPITCMCNSVYSCLHLTCRWRSFFLFFFLGGGGGGSCKMCFTRCYLFVDHIDQSGSCPPFMIMLLAARAVVFCFIAGTLHVISDCSQYCLCRVYDFTPLHVGTA